MEAKYTQYGAQNQVKSKNKLFSFDQRHANRAARRLKSQEHIFLGLIKKLEDWLKYSPFGIAILNRFVWASLTFKNSLEWTNKYIADTFNCCTKTVQRFTNFFDELNLFVKTNRFKKASLFKVNQLIYSPLFRETFKHLLPALAAPLFSLNLIFETAIQSAHAKGVQQVNSNINMLRSNRLGIGYWVPKSPESRTQSFQQEKNTMILYDSTKNLATKYWTLTDVGRCKLQPFPEEIIHHVIQWAYGDDCPRWPAFMEFLKQECADRNIRPDWYAETKAMNHFGFTNDMPFYNAKFQKPKTHRFQPKKQGNASQQGTQDRDIRSSSQFHQLAKLMGEEAAERYCLRSGLGKK